MVGQISLWNAAEQYIEGVVERMRVVQIFDALNACSCVWSVAHVFHPKESLAALNVAKGGIRRILTSEFLAVIKGLRWKEHVRWFWQEKAKGTRSDVKISAEQRPPDTVWRIPCSRLSNNFAYAIEGAYRYLVKDRMERAGMCWVLDSVQSMLSLWSISLSDLWDEITRFRIETKTCVGNLFLLQRKPTRVWLLLHRTNGVSVSPDEE